ncbi:MAG: peptide deformylase [Candidatus Spechtbacteria bacterium]|nr:peptide deformylase [Candidatus Spechtbacteria bacterium]
MIRKVVQDQNPILHKKTLPIAKGFRSRTLEKLIEDMKDTLRKQDGLGLAGPQIGESLSIFVIPDRLAPEVRTPYAPFSFLKPLHPAVFINPEVLTRSKTKEIMEEGCLSIHGIFKETSRFLEVKIKAQDELGRKFSVKTKGLLARVFQHEIDHLNGILFIER